MLHYQAKKEMSPIFVNIDSIIGRKNANIFPLSKEAFGRVFGLVKEEGNGTAQYVLKVNGEILSISTLRPLQVIKLHSVIEAKKR